MAHQIDEFVNPKSMLTPGAAAAVVATVAGAIFSTFGLQLPFVLLFCSLFVGAVVFFSREFADPGMRIHVKTFFYVLNSFIIFAMATGTHAVLDKERRERRADKSTGGIFISSAYAQATKSPGLTVKQERPVFYDWTREPPKDAASAAAAGPIAFSTEKDYGSLRGVLVNAGLATPDYKVRLQIDESKLPPGATIKSIQWRLPSAYFKDDSLASSQAWDGTRFTIEAWKPFRVEADITLSTGEKLSVHEMISFPPPSK